MTRTAFADIDLQQGQPGSGLCCVSRRSYLRGCRYDKRNDESAVLSAFFMVGGLATRMARVPMRRFDTGPAWAVIKAGVVAGLCQPSRDHVLAAGSLSSDRSASGLSDQAKALPLHILRTTGDSMRAHQIMTQQVITVGADTPIVEAADTMLRHHISGLPVVDAAGELIGIISEGDFIRRAEIGTQRKRGRWLTFLVSTDRIAADFVHEHGRKVGDIMTPDPLDRHRGYAARSDRADHGIQQRQTAPGGARQPPGRHCDPFGFSCRRRRACPQCCRARPQMTSDFAAPSSAAIGQAAWRPCRLNVTVRDGIVSLSGVIKNENARQAAIVAAENVPGVKHVLDNFARCRSTRRRKRTLAAAISFHCRSSPRPRMTSRCERPAYKIMNAYPQLLCLASRLPCSEGLRRLLHRISKTAGGCRSGGARSVTPSGLLRANSSGRESFASIAAKEIVTAEMIASFLRLPHADHAERAAHPQRRPGYRGVHHGHEEVAAMPAASGPTGPRASSTWIGSPLSNPSLRANGAALRAPY